MTSSEYFSSLSSATLNAAHRVTLVWNPPAPASDDPWLDAQTASGTDAVEIERAAVALAAELAGAQIDRDLFRGALPPGLREGIFLRISANLPPAERRVREYLIALEGRSAERDALTSICETLASRLPLPAPVTVTADTLTAPVTFANFARHGSISYGRSGEDGKLRYSCRAEFKASVLI